MPLDPRRKFRPLARRSSGSLFAQTRLDPGFSVGPYDLGGVGEGAPRGCEPVGKLACSLAHRLGSSVAFLEGLSLVFLSVILRYLLFVPMLSSPGYLLDRTLQIALRSAHVDHRGMSPLRIVPGGIVCKDHGLHLTRIIHGARFCS